MDTLGAMRATMEAACERLPATLDNALVPEAASMSHLVHMLTRVELSMTENIVANAMSVSKINRWLGYMQGVLVARGLLTLEECKQINREHAG